MHCIYLYNIILYIYILCAYIYISCIFKYPSWGEIFPIFFSLHSQLDRLEFFFNIYDLNKMTKYDGYDDDDDVVCNKKRYFSLDFFEFPFFFSFVLLLLRNQQVSLAFSCTIPTVDDIQYMHDSPSVSTCWMIKSTFPYVFTTFPLSLFLSISVSRFCISSIFFRATKTFLW